MKTAVDYLKAALRDLYTSRGELDRQITVLERTLDELDNRSDAAGAVSAAPPTIRQIALALARERGVVTPSLVMAAAAETGNDAKYESVSSILSRLHKEGELARGVKRGEYKLPPSTHHDDDAPEPQAPRAVGEVATISTWSSPES